MSATNDTDESSDERLTTACGHGTRSREPVEKALTESLAVFKEPCDDCWDNPPEFGSRVLVFARKQTYHRPAEGCA